MWLRSSLDWLLVSFCWLGGADMWTKRRIVVAIILSAMTSSYISYLSYKGAFDSVRLDNVIGNALDGAMKEVGGTIK